MKPFSVRKAAGIRGVMYVPPDKSIAHRALIISAIASGRTTIYNFPLNEDCLSTLKALRRLGVRIVLDRRTKKVDVYGKGLRGLRPVRSPIYMGESGTTLRLLLGVLSGQNFSTVLVTAPSLSRRPMLRVNEPLRMMAATIKARVKSLPPWRDPALREKAKVEEYPPLTIQGGRLVSLTYTMPIASAQVKSAILFAGLYAKGCTTVIERFKSRDHTERMLTLFKAGITVKGNTVTIRGGRELVSPQKIYIPADISSASFFMVLAALLPDSCLVIKNVNLNPSRTGVIRVLKAMGADIKVKSKKSIGKSFEPTGDLRIKSSSLRGTIVKKSQIPSLIDELPILIVAACFAKGRTRFESVQELKVKETDRVRSLYENLTPMGARMRVIRRGPSEDILVEGVSSLRGGCLKSYGDHRTAMSMVIAGLLAEGSTVIDDISCIKKSFPEFLAILKPLIR